jgi:predicted transcriptional regulator
MEQTLQKQQPSDSNEKEAPNQAHTEPTSKDTSASELISTLRNIKIEEQELLAKRKELQANETELRNQALAEIDAKKMRITGLKTEIELLQNKCNELEEALGIPVYK